MDVSCDSTIFAGYDSYGLYFWRQTDQKVASSFPMDKLEGVHPLIRKAAFSGKDRQLIAVLTDDGCDYLYDCVREEILRVIHPGLCLYNSETAQRIKSLYEGCSGLKMTARSGLLYVFQSGYSHGIVRVLDMSTAEEIGSFRSNYPHHFFYRGTDSSVSQSPRDEELCIEDLSFSAESSLLMVNTGHGSNTFQMDPSIFVYSTDAFEEAWHVGYDGGECGTEGVRICFRLGNGRHG